MDHPDQLTEFERAFKKLKASVYYEKTSVVLCRKLAEYEAFLDFGDNLELLKTRLSGNVEEWQRYVDSLIGRIDCFAFPKKMENTVVENNKREENNPVYICNCPPIRPVVEECQFFIDMPVEAYLLGVLWVMRIGVHLDEMLSDDVYGNRVRQTKDGRPHADDSTPYMFKPYFGQYKSWRDRAVAAAERASKDDGHDVCIVSLDFKSFFYGVRFTEEEWNNALSSIDKQVSGLKENRRLHKFCFSVFKKYAEVVSEETKNYQLREAPSILPIGFAPSMIASNWCLHKFDEEVVKRIDPLYYGRYVDDILIVKRNYDDKDQFKLENFLWDFLTDHSFSNEMGPQEDSHGELMISKDFLEAEESQVVFQQKKTKVFFLSANAPQALLLRLKEEIRKNSSEFRLMPDIFGMTIEDSYVSIFDYQFNGSPNKLRNIENINLDKFGFAKYLGCMQKVLPALEDNRKTALLTELVNLLDGSLLIDCYIYWERIIEILVCASAPDLLNKFITKVSDAINRTNITEGFDVNVDNSSGIKKDFAIVGNPESNLVKQSLWRFLIAAAMRASALIQDSVIDEIIAQLCCLKEPISFNDEIVYEDNKKRYYRIKRSFWYTQLLNASAIAVLPVFVSYESVFNNLGKQVNFSKLEDILEYLILPKKGGCNNKQLLPYVVKTQDIEHSIYIQKIAYGEDVNNALDVHEKARNLYRLLNFYLPADDEVCDVKRINSSRIIERDLAMQELGGAKKNYCINVASNKHLDSRKIRVAVANMQLNEKSIVRVLKKEQRTNYSRYEDLRQLTTDAKRCGANMLVLPEASVPISMLPFLIKFSEKEDIAVICGIEHVLGGKDRKKVYNLTATILPYRDRKNEWEFAKLTLHQKVYFSPAERSSIYDHGCVCAEGSTFELYSWKNIWFPIYCCYELTSIRSRAVFQCYADMVIVPIWNKDIHYYEHIEYSLSRDLTCFCVQVNNAIYGDSCIIQPSNRTEATLLRVKGGTNTTVLAADLDIKGLRDAQVTKSGERFKPTSPDFDFEIVEKKNNGSLFDFISDHTPDVLSAAETESEP